VSRPKADCIEPDLEVLGRNLMERAFYLQILMLRSQISVYGDLLRRRKMSETFEKVRLRVWIQMS
jgi:hypothetical protein